MALVSNAARPWQLARHKLIRPNVVNASFRQESSEAAASTSDAPLFPWRHSAEPINRVVNKDNLSGLPTKTKKDDSFFQKVMMASMLKRDWYEMLLPSVWRESLANDCAWAFQKGVAALLSRVFSVPIDDIDQEELGIIFEMENLNAKANHSTLAGEKEESEKGSTEETTEDAGAKETLVEEEDKLCTLMLEKKLIERYAKYVDPTTTDLILCMKPLSSKLENIFSVSFTREAVEKDASLAEAGRKMRYTAQVDRNPVEATRMLKDLDEKGKPISLFTIIADVSIQCLEAFAVKDKSTGEILSGSTEPEEVSHLVRFEVTTNLDGSRRLGSWRIVDWDDLLEGNVWY